MKILGILFLTALITSGCTHALHQYQAGDVGAVKNVRKITSLGEQNGFLAFRFNTDYVDQAWTNLQAQCPKGKVSSIHTRFSTSHGFFSWNNQVQMTAYCQE
jgi:hypothetical protein